MKTALMILVTLLGLSCAKSAPKKPGANETGTASPSGVVLEAMEALETADRDRLSRLVTPNVYKTFTTKFGEPKDDSSLSSVGKALRASVISITERRSDTFVVINVGSGLRFTRFLCQRVGNNWLIVDAWGEG